MTITSQWLAGVAFLFVALVIFIVVLRSEAFRGHPLWYKLPFLGSEPNKSFDG